MAVRPKIMEMSNGGRFHQAIVGESFYQRALRLLAPVRQDGFREAIVGVYLVPDPKNEYDSNAVGIWTFRGQIGHLSREDAAIHQAACLRTVEAHGAYPGCQAHLVDAGEGTFVGAWLDIDLEALHSGEIPV